MSNADAIGSRIKMLRKSKQMTQRELADILSISYGSIVDYENGRREPNSKAMAALEQYFGVTGSYLRGETDAKVHDQPAGWSCAPEEYKALHEDFSGHFARLAESLAACNDFEQQMASDIFLELRHVLKMKETAYAAKDVSARAVTLGMLQKTVYFVSRFSDCVLRMDAADVAPRTDRLIEDTIKSFGDALRKSVRENYPANLTTEEIKQQMSGLIELQNAQKNSRPEDNSESTYTIAAENGTWMNDKRKKKVSGEISALPFDNPDL